MNWMAQQNTAPSAGLLPGSVTNTVLEECNFIREDKFQAGNTVDHGLHRTVGLQDSLQRQLVKGEDLLNLFPLSVEDVR